VLEPQKIQANIDTIIKSISKDSIKELISWINSLFFPSNEFWMWYPVKYENERIAPKTRFELWDRRDNGWVFYSLFWADNPSLRFQLDVYADSKLDIDIDFETLDTIGGMGLGQGYFNVTKYDPVNNVYVAQYSPIGFGVPFRGRSTAYLINPTTSTINVRLVYGWLIILK